MPTLDEIRKQFREGYDPDLDDEDYGAVGDVPKTVAKSKDDDFKVDAPEVRCPEHKCKTTAVRLRVSYKDHGEEKEAEYLCDHPGCKVRANFTDNDQIISMSREESNPFENTAKTMKAVGVSMEEAHEAVKAFTNATSKALAGSFGSIAKEETEAESPPTKSKINWKWFDLSDCVNWISAVLLWAILIWLCLP